MEKNFFCLLTGYLNTAFNDGGTLGLFNILERLNRDGFNSAMLNLTPRESKPHKDVLEKARRGEAEIASEDKNAITFRLKNYSFPFTFYFTGIDIRGAYRNRRKKDFNRLLYEWEFLGKLNGKRRNEANFYSNIGYQLGALSPSRKHLLFLDN